MLDKQLVDSVFDAIKDNPKVSKMKPQDVKNTLYAVSMRMLHDTHKIDTLTLLDIYCAMIGIKNTFKPTRFYVRSRPYNTEDTENGKFV